MNPARLRTFLSSPTAKLAGTYLLIILVMSIGFSFVLYNTSSHELGRQIPPDSFFHQGGPGSFAGNDNGTAVNMFLQARITEARHALIMRLVYLNLSVLLLGILVSHYLARRTLQPIEDAMEAQVQFVSDASHELRTPLTAIQTSNEVALRKAKLTLPDARLLIEHNTEDVKKLKLLSDGLLNLAQHGKTDVILGPVKLQQTVSEAMTMVVQQATDKNIAVHDAVADIAVTANKQTLVQVLVILLDNAVKYSHDNGTIYLETRTKGKAVFIDVRDEGIGIRASDMPHLFRRFYRADNARSTGRAVGGYGLGLAIAKQIIEAQHGEISVVSTPGKGSTFSIKLPVAAGESTKNGGPIKS